MVKSCFQALRKMLQLRSHRDDLTSMGLDIWSTSDRAFVEDFVRMWWGREVNVKGGTIECCGIQVL